MDRHDVSDTVTAENVAQLHKEDLKIQDQFGCKGLTYWFDEKRKHAFCLIEAPDANAIQSMHKHAHGEVPNRIIEVDGNIVESFLGRIQDPEKAKNSELNIIRDAAFRIIMVIALKKLKPLQYASEKLKSSFKKLNSEISNTLNVYEGNPVTQSDYYYLVSFKSVSNAVQAALKIQSQFKNFNKNNQHIILKIGLSAGVPVTKKQSIFEEAIKLAERTCEIIKDEIIISSEVKDLYESEKAGGFSNEKNICFLTKADEKFITLLMDYADGCWNNINLKVDDFSKPMQCSKSQLYRKLILLTGQSPNSFIKEYRLKEALKLLNKKAGNISEIAFETGFSSPSYFSKCFQKKYGCMPSDFLSMN
jgi:AraC-like DNA-binding protein